MIIGNDCKHTIYIVNVLLDAALRQLDDGDWMIEVTMIELSWCIWRQLARMKTFTGM